MIKRWFFLLRGSRASLPLLNMNKGGIAEARAEREVAQTAYEIEIERIIGQLAQLRLSGSSHQKAGADASSQPRSHGRRQILTLTIC